jgi:hypothetical protein
MLVRLLTTFVGVVSSRKKNQIASGQGDAYTKNGKCPHRTRAIAGMGGSCGLGELEFVEKKKASVLPPAGTGAPERRVLDFWDSG